MSFIVFCKVNSIRKRNQSLAVGQSASSQTPQITPEIRQCIQSARYKMPKFSFKMLVFSRRRERLLFKMSKYLKKL
jgi:hypothetical protein